MGQKTRPLDPAFIDAQKERLLKLKAELTAANEERDAEVTDAQEAQAGQPREYEDDAQHLTEYELAGQLGESVARRLSAIDRALQKISDGTYGESDLSGQAIPMARLQAMPEAIYTKKEQQARDALH